MIGKTFPKPRKLSVFEDREMGGLVICGFFLVVVPTVTFAALMLVTMWASAFNLFPDVHGTLWGWLSNHDSYQQDGQKVYYWRPGGVILPYFASVLTAYLFYQACEGANWCFQTFKKALS